MSMHIDLAVANQVADAKTSSESTATEMTATEMTATEMTATESTATESTATPTGAAPIEPPLPNDVSVLQQMIRELLQTLGKTQQERDGLQQRLDLLLRKMFGQRSERVDPNQPWLFPELQQLLQGQEQVAPSQSEQATPGATKDAKIDGSSKPRPKGHGRKPLPESLPRETKVLELPEAQRLCPCCGVVCAKFGEETSDQLDYKPASVFVRVFVRHKYACPKCHDHVTVAPKPPQPIAKGLPGPGLLAYIATSKYTDHLPLHRLERILRRHGIDLSRRTMCDWMGDLAHLLEPIVLAMRRELLMASYLHTDATKLPYQDPLRPGKTQSGQLWVYLGDFDHPFNLFHFSRDHSGAALYSFLGHESKYTGTGQSPTRLGAPLFGALGQFTGHLQADASNLYDQLFQGGTVLEVGCWAHARRYFFDARNSEPQLAHEAMARIRKLYKIEDQAKLYIAEHKLDRSAADAVRYRLRQEQALPEIIALEKWLKDLQPRVLPKSLFGQAVNYALNHWQALERYTAAGHLDIDNNRAEQALRAVVLGRKNWLYAGSERGAATAATLFSIASSCTRHGLDVYAYLQAMIEYLIETPKPDHATLRSLLPDRWRPPTPPATPPDSASAATGAP